MIAGRQVGNRSLQNLLRNPQAAVLPSTPAGSIFQVHQQVYQVHQPVSKVHQPVFKVLQQVSKVLQQVFKVHHLVLKVLHLVLQVLEQVLKLPQQVFQVLQQVFNVFEQVFQLPQQVFQLLHPEKKQGQQARITGIGVEGQVYRRSAAKRLIFPFSVRGSAGTKMISRGCS